MHQKPVNPRHFPAVIAGLLADDAAMEKYEALHDRYAPFVRDLTYEMRGFYLKNAQLMSTRDEFVPPQAALRRLHLSGRA